MRVTARRWAARAAVVAGVLLAAGCTAGPGGQAASPPSGLRAATATAGAPVTGTRPGHPVTVYVLMPGAGDHDGAVVAIDAATGTPGPAIGLHTSSDFMADGIAVTPDGKTAYVLSGEGGIYPISTATGRVGAAIEVGDFPRAPQTVPGSPRRHGHST
jgi:DNA-binding beta-propeller fold protein YncE